METTIIIITILTCILIYIYVFNKLEKTIYFLQNLNTLNSELLILEKNIIHEVYY